MAAGNFAGGGIVENKENSTARVHAVEECVNQAPAVSICWHLKKIILKYKKGRIEAWRK